MTDTTRRSHADGQDRRRQVADSLNVGNPANNARHLALEVAGQQECQMVVGVDDIRPYEHNPRRTINARFADIKESIRAAGIRNPLTVTRRPGDAHFIIESGGNTRLLALQQLWAETGDSRFEKLSVVFRPWRSESHVLTAHMVENEQRGDMTFWDRATGIIAIKGRLETEKGQPLSLRQLEAELGAMGLASNPTSLSHYIFATERLRVLGESIPELSAQDIKTIQPRLNALKRHVLAGGTSEAVFHESLVDPLLQEAADRYRKGEGFVASQFCVACEVAVASHLGQSVSGLRANVDALSRPRPDLPREVSREPDASPVPRPADACVLPPGARSVRLDTPAVNAVDSASSRSVPMVPSTNTDSQDATGITCGERAFVAELAQRLAELAGIDGHLRFDPMSPLGVWTIVDTSVERDLHSSALRVWCLLSHLAETAHVSRSRLAPDDEGVVRRTSCAARTNDGVRLHEEATDLLDWLLKPDDPMAGATLEFLHQLRIWRTKQGSRPIVPELQPDPLEDA